MCLLSLPLTQHVCSFKDTLFSPHIKAKHNCWKTCSQGKVVAHDWFERQLKIHYDDGVEEHILPFCDSFRWLTPRAVTAGATDAVHSSFVYLRAGNAGELQILSHG